MYFDLKDSYSQEKKLREENFISNFVLPIGSKVVIKNDYENFGNDAGKTKIITGYKMWEKNPQGGYELDNGDGIWLIEDFDPNHMNYNETSYRAVLCDLKKVFQLETQEYDYEQCDLEDWAGEVSFNGIKRYIYGLWHNGENEQGHDMISNMGENTKEEYEKLMAKYSNKKELIVNII
jgi:hypothetical protein